MEWGVWSGVGQKGRSDLLVAPGVRIALFYKAFRGGYKVFGLFEISLEHTLEGFAVASFVVVFVGTE